MGSLRNVEGPAVKDSGPPYTPGENIASKMDRAVHHEDTGCGAYLVILHVRIRTSVRYQHDQSIFGCEMRCTAMISLAAGQVANSTHLNAFGNTGHAALALRG